MLISKPLRLRWGDDQVVKASGLATFYGTWQELKRHVLFSGRGLPLSSREQREAGLPPAARLRIGGLWFLPFKNVVANQCSVSVSDDVLQEFYEGNVSEQSGLLPVNLIYDVLEQLGRPGLPYEQFKNFVTKLGIRLEDRYITSAFQQIDTNQDQVLDQAELRRGIDVLVKDMIPRTVLRRLSLSVEQNLQQIFSALLILLVIFMFLVLSFMAFLGGRASGVSSAIQSVLAAASALGVKGEKGGLKLEKLMEMVQQNLEEIMGFGLGGKRKKDGEKKG